MIRLFRVQAILGNEIIIFALCLILSKGKIIIDGLSLNAVFGHGGLDELQNEGAYKVLSSQLLDPAMD